jgi:hypothetical protein
MPLASPPCSPASAGSAFILSVACPDDSARGRERASRVLRQQNRPNGTTHRRFGITARALFDDDDDDDGARSGRVVPPATRAAPSPRPGGGGGCRSLNPSEAAPLVPSADSVWFGTTTRGWASFAGGRRRACSDHPVAASRSVPKSCRRPRLESAARCFRSRRPSRHAHRRSTLRLSLCAPSRCLSPSRPRPSLPCNERSPSLV